MVAEMLQAEDDTAARLRKTHSIPFRYNFMAGTTRQVDYINMPSFHAFLNKAIR